VGRAVAVLIVLAGCGRIGFEQARDGSVVGGVDDAVDTSTGGSSAAIQYVKPFAERHPGPGGADTFTAQASAAGDVVILQVGCGDNTTMGTSVTVTATGAWTFQRTLMGTLPLAQYNALSADTFYAVAPDAQATSVTVMWNSPCGIGTSVLADEFANVDTTAPIDRAGQGGLSGNCNGGVLTQFANAAAWAACFSATAVGGIPAGYNPGANNGGGDRAAYKLTMDPAQTVETATFPNSSDYVISNVTLKPR
jgi:hypothetical protein